MPDDAGSVEQRKKKLIAQGAAFRARMIDAKLGVQESLQPDVLAKDAFHHIATAAIAALGNGGAARIAAANLPTVLPLVLSGISALSKRSLLRPALRGLAMAGLAGAAVMLVLKIKKRRKM